MKLLVSGGTGFIGKHLISGLAAQHEVLSLTQNPLPSLKEKVSVIAMDLSRPLDREMLPKKADVIIHLAQANVSVPEGANELFAVNTRSTQELLDYGRRAGVRRFVLASSGDVYGHRLGICRETDVPQPTSLYAVSKYASELLVRAYSPYMETCILRLFQPYGPVQKNRLIPRLAKRITQGQTLQIHKGGRPHLTPLYIGDVVIAFERAILSSFSGTVNLAGDTLISLRDLAIRLGKRLNREPLFEETGQEAGDLAGDNSAMKQAFGSWPLVGLEEGLGYTFQNSEDIRCQTRV